MMKSLLEPRDQSVLRTLRHEPFRFQHAEQFRPVRQVLLGHHLKGRVVLNPGLHLNREFTVQQPGVVPIQQPLIDRDVPTYAVDWRSSS